MAITTIDLATKNEICEALHVIENYCYQHLTHDLVADRHFLYNGIAIHAAVIAKVKAAGIPVTEFKSVEALRATCPDVEHATFGSFDAFNVRRHGGF